MTCVPELTTPGCHRAVQQLYTIAATPETLCLPPVEPDLWSVNETRRRARLSQHKHDETMEGGRYCQGG